MKLIKTVKTKLYLHMFYCFIEINFCTGSLFNNIY